MLRQVSERWVEWEDYTLEILTENVFKWILLLIRQPTAEHTVEHNTKAVDIRASVRLSVMEDLWGNEARGSSRYLFSPNELLGDSQVNQFYLIFSGHDNVLWFYIQVKDILSVKIVHGLKQLSHKYFGVAFFDVPIASVVQLLSFHVF